MSSVAKAVSKLHDTHPQLSFAWDALILMAEAEDMTFLKANDAGDALKIVMDKFDGNERMLSAVDIVVALFDSGLFDSKFIYKNEIYQSMDDLPEDFEFEFLSAALIPKDE